VAADLKDRHLLRS